MCTDNGKTKRMRQRGMQNVTDCHEKNNCYICTISQISSMSHLSLLIVHCFPVPFFQISQTVTDRGSRGVIKKTKTFTFFSLLPQLLFFMVLLDIFF